MTRDDGFAVMDVSSDYVNDPKWRKLHRAHPDLFAAAFVAYTATMCESWKAGRRVSIEDAWPVILPYDAEVVAALRTATFIDRHGLIVIRSWDGWFGPANRRREIAREAGREGNARRWGTRSGGDRVAIGSESGADPSTVPSVPTVPTGPFRSVAREEHVAKPRNGRMEPIADILRRTQ